MLDQLGSVIETLKSCAGFDAGELDGAAAMEVYGRFAEVERLAAVGKLAAGSRVAATEEWRRGGSRSAADWLARESRSDPGRVRDGLETAEGLENCPVVAGEFRAGRLSVDQAHVIVDALAAVPAAESRLVEYAQTHSLRQLRDECRCVKATDASGEEELNAVHRSRELRTWIGRDGAYCGSWRLPADRGAEFQVVLDERKEKIARAARKEGLREPFGAYAADALVQLVSEASGAARGGLKMSSRPKAMVVVHVAYEAIVRGALSDGDVCEVAGFGPVPLEAARRLAADSTLRVLVTKGGQPMAVTEGKRTVPRALRILLEARDKVCAIVGCDCTAGLQVEHRQDFALLGPTDLENCAMVCPRHHDMKTYLGFRMVPAGGAKWYLVPPDDYRDPEPADSDIGETLFTNPWTGRDENAPVSGGSTDSREPARDGPGGPEQVDQLDLVGAAGPAP